MQLNISEINDINNSFLENYDHSFIEQIPENNKPIKVIKKSVHFDESVKPMNQSIPKINARIVRPKNIKVEPKISYDEILSKMGVKVANGKLHAVEKQPINSQPINFKPINSQPINSQQPIKKHPLPNNEIPENSYIYNKYFKSEIQPSTQIRVPRTLDEYKRMVLQNYLQKIRINQIKSKKLIIPSTNINMANSNSANLNKLFNFSQR